MISPLSVIGKLRPEYGGKIFIELTAKNKNRDLIASHLVSAAASGFDGAVLASGVFDKKPGMARPVYDLDPSQMLKAALGLRAGGKLPAGFIIAVRSAVSEGAAMERARWLLRQGADFLAVTGAPPGEFAGRALIIEEIPSAQ
jgi:5,10-methylenetetrahydrofolate reductase